MVHWKHLSRAVGAIQCYLFWTCTLVFSFKLFHVQWFDSHVYLKLRLKILNINVVSMGRVDIVMHPNQWYHTRAITKVATRQGFNYKNIIQKLCFTKSPKKHDVSQFFKIFKNNLNTAEPTSYCLLTDSSNRRLVRNAALKVGLCTAKLLKELKAVKKNWFRMRWLEIVCRDNISKIEDPQEFSTIFEVLSWFNFLICAVLKHALGLLSNLLARFRERLSKVLIFILRKHNVF